MAQQGEWGDHVSLQAVSNIWHRCIRVYNNGGSADGYLTIEPHEGLPEGNAGEEIVLAFVGEIHYRATQSLHSGNVITPGTWEEMEKARKKIVGEANFQHLMDQAEGLKALEQTPEGKAWLEALVPSSSEEGKALFNLLKEAVTKHVKAFLTDQNTHESIQEKLAEAETFFAGRIEMYKAALASEEAQRQVCTLISLLDAMFRSGYKNIRDTWIVIGDKDALKALDEWSRNVSSKMRPICASENNFVMCYVNACKEELQSKYKSFMKGIAAKTRGQVKFVPVKNPFRAKEKTAMRYNFDDRFRSDNLYDVVRGCIVFP
jgi:hypothetical protein